MKVERTRAVSSEVRILNRNLVFRYLYEHEPATKQELATALNMSPPTISLLLSELMEASLVIDAGTLASTGGRKAHKLTINSRSFYSVGIDITVNHLTIVLIDLSGKIVSMRRLRIPFSRAEAYYRNLAWQIEEQLDDDAIDRKSVIGVGIAMPAIVSQDGTELTYASVLGFSNGKLEEVTQFIPYPCRFFNDASMGGVAELWSCPEWRDRSRDYGVVYLSLSNTVGGAFLLNGAIYSGEHQRASEFGHMVLVPNGRTCYCQQHGCVDAYLSASQLSNYTDGNLAAFFEALGAGEPDMVQVWHEYIGYLTIAVSNLHAAYDCRVVVGGYIGCYIDPYVPEIRQLLAEMNHFDHDGDYFSACVNKNEAAAMGAALMYIDQILKQI